MFKSFLVISPATATADETTPASNSLGIPEDNPNPCKTVWEKLVKQGEIPFAPNRFFPFPYRKGTRK
jgi:hypothetical protein